MGALIRATQISAQTGGFRRLWRALWQLFHELTAVVFAVLAFSWLSSAFRAWSRDTARWLIGLALAMAVLFGFFAVTQYLRSRRL